MKLPWLGKSKNPFPWLLGTIAVAVLLVGTVTYRISQNPRSQEKLQESTVKVIKQDLKVKIQASGTVEPIERVKISPKSSGRLAKLLVEQGDRVEKGQTLAIMDNEQLEAEKLQAEANLSGAIANLEEAKDRIPEEIKQAKAKLSQARASLLRGKQRIPREIEQARAQVNSARSRMKLARERLKRYEYLAEQGAESRDRYDEAFNEFSTAEASLLEALQRLQQSQNTSRPEIDQLEAAVAEAERALTLQQRTADDKIAQLAAAKRSAEAQFKVARVRYNDTFLIAPFEGIVTQKEATEGEIVSPSLGAGSSSILELARGLEVIAKVPEVDVGQLQLGQQVTIVASAYPDRVVRGKIKLVAPEAKVENNVTSFEVRVSLITGQDLLRSKMNVDVTFLGETIEDALVIPTVAIRTEKGETGVLVLGSKDRSEFKPVTLGITLDNQTQILDGLEADDRVFITPPQQLRRNRGN
ncbi:MAG: efflux RND transporter periplasmic adaptor subunit [Prochloraceae cyanobacterium]|nr:efflux RND transporter periplasmic adaptor subunit [Prochloraceae cyanobacterium]